MKLTAKFIQSITTPGRFVLAQSHTRKRDGETMIRLSFVQRLTVHGKRVDIGLGSPKWGAVTLSDARAKAVANHRIARTGGDPRRGAATVPTFEEAADAVIRMHAATWRDGGKTEKQWRASLRDYAVPKLGKMPVSRIASADVLAVLIPIWNTKRETARRVRQRIGAVLKWSIAEGHRTDNPAGDAIAEALPKNGNHRKHFQALPHERVSGAVRRVRASKAWAGTRLAFEFLVLTAARSGEVRGARWHEIDMDAAIWTIPGERMKAGKPYRVPLTGRAIEVLQEAAAYRDSSGLVFPSARGKVLSDMTMSKLLKGLRIDAVPHGFRSSFRDWASERTNTPHAVMEAALAHVVRDKVEAAYARSDLLDKRRELMERWAAYLARESATVVAIR